MVFGNLSTGYWLGAAAAAGIHWVELGRKTLTGTSDTINVAGHNWVEYAGDVDIDTGNTELDFHIESGTNGAKGYIDLTSVSDTQWVLRFEKVNFSTINTYGEMWLGLSSITSANGANSGSMVAARPGDYGDSDDYLAVQSFNSSTTEVTGNEVRPDYSTGVDYDIEIKRTSATAVEAKLYTNNFGTLVGTSSSTISGTTGLRYLFVGSRHNTGAGNTNTNFVGTIQSVKFWNNTTSTSGTPTLSESFSGLTAKPYMMVLHHGIASGNIASRLRFNSDTGSNYAQRGSRNGASDSTGTSRDNVSFSLNPGNASDEFLTAMVNNTADQEKTWVSHGIDGTTGAGNDPNHSEIVGKWTNTSDSITSVNVYHTESGDYASGSECVVLGCDPDDTEGTSVWEELGSGDTDGSSQTLTTGTFTAKKYLWFQAFNIGGGTSADVWLRFNDDAGANYVRTFHSNGGANDVAINQSNGVSNVVISGTSGQAFCNGLIINKSDEEKFMFVDQIVNGSTGAGNAPSTRYESFNKWTNTSSQINKISIVSQTGNFSSGCYIKVWGFD